MSFNNVPSLSQVHSGVQTASTEQQPEQGVNVFPPVSYQGTIVSSGAGSPTDIIFGRHAVIGNYGPTTESLSILAEATDEAYKMSQTYRNRGTVTELTGCTCKSRYKTILPCTRTQNDKKVYNFRQRKNGTGEYTCILFERWMAWFGAHHRVYSQVHERNGAVTIEYGVCCEQCDCVGKLEFLFTRFPMCDGVDCEGQH